MKLQPPAQKKRKCDRCANHHRPTRGDLSTPKRKGHPRHRPVLAQHLVAHQRSLTLGPGEGLVSSVTQVSIFDVAQNRAQNPVKRTTKPRCRAKTASGATVSNFLLRVELTVCPVWGCGPVSFIRVVTWHSVRQHEHLCHPGQSFQHSDKCAIPKPLWGPHPAIKFPSHTVRPIAGVATQAARFLRLSVHSSSPHVRLPPHALWLPHCSPFTTSSLLRVWGGWPQ